MNDLVGVRPLKEKHDLGGGEEHRSSKKAVFSGFDVPLRFR